MGAFDAEWVQGKRATGILPLAQYAENGLIRIMRRCD